MMEPVERLFVVQQTDSLIKAGALCVNLLLERPAGGQRRNKKCLLDMRLSYMMIRDDLIIDPCSIRRYNHDI